MKIDRDSLGSLAIVYGCSAALIAVVLCFVHLPWLRWSLIVLILWPCCCGWSCDAEGPDHCRRSSAAVGPLLPVLAPDIFRWSWTVCSFPVAVCK